MKVQYQKPSYALSNLKRDFNCSKVSELRDRLGSAKHKVERELFYGAIFAECLNKVSKNDYLIRMPEKDEACDCELLDYTEYKKWENDNKYKTKNHFLLQNVSITFEAIAQEVKKGHTDVYDIFKNHLIRTKLSPEAGDYSGCILVFYITGLRGQINIEKLRKTLRNVDQDDFEQIWVIAPDQNKYSIVELLRENGEGVIADFSNE